MARRDRTTGLPRPRPRTNTRTRQAVGGLPIDERQVRFGVLGVAAVLLLVVIGLFAYRWYDNTYARPDRTILTVGEEKFSLGYYADRLLGYVQASQQQAGTSLVVAEQALVSQMESEALTHLIAKDRGITITEEDITNEIAAGLGVPVGGSGSSFDTLYRQRLTSLKMSDRNFRRQTAAIVAQTKVLDSYKEEIGETGQLVTLRHIVSPTQEAADAIAARVRGGEDFGTVAQTESTDLTTRQQDGLMTPAPPVLLPESIRTAIEGKDAGSEVFGPVLLGTNYWTFQVDKRDPAGTLSDQDRTQMAQLRLADDLKAKRASTTVRRSLSTSDIEWAEKNAD